MHFLHNILHCHLLPPSPQFLSLPPMPPPSLLSPLLFVTFCYDWTWWVEECLPFFAGRSYLPGDIVYLTPWADPLFPLWPSDAGMGLPQQALSVWTTTLEQIHQPRSWTHSNVKILSGLVAFSCSLGLFVISGYKFFFSISLIDTKMHDSTHTWLSTFSHSPQTVVTPLVAALSSLIPALHRSPSC